MQAGIIVYLLLSSLLMGQQRKNSHKLYLSRRLLIVFLVICLLFLNSLTRAQLKKITYPTPQNDSTLLLSKTDSTLKDSTKLVSIPISKDKIESEVSYHSIDSIVYDAKEKKLHLYRGATISYEDIKVNADYIFYTQDSSTLTALELDAYKSDSTRGDKPTLAQGGESSTFSSLLYNFKSKRALVENAYSQYGEGFILSKQVKRNNDNSINGLHNIYTTCNAETPHFGIAAKKIKIIPQKVAVSGSANLVIEEIPTPLILPFGMFPLKQGQRSGFKLPTYDVSPNMGFGIREGGYYFALNDHWDLLALADIYTLGTWRAGFKSNYIYRYRFNGTFAFNYAFNKIGEEFEPNFNVNRNFMLNWSHAVNPAAMPGSQFSANVNVGSSKYQINNTYDPNLLLNNNYTSNISYSKNWQGRPFNFTASLRHNQNTATREVNVTLPQMNFTVNQFFPFLYRKDVIKPRWYEKITASYNAEAINNLRFTDSSFSLRRIDVNQFQNGIKHSIPLSANYNLLKYINTAFNVNYNELWYSQKLFRQYNFSEGRIDTTRTNGFYTARYFDAGITASTRIYGMKMFKKGKIKGIRHVLTPSLNFNYRPDFASPRFNYYYNTFIDQNYNPSMLPYFEGAIFGAPPSGKVGGLGINIGNTLQMKVRSGKDSSGERKVNLIDGLNFSTFYNRAVDSFRWNNINMSYRTTLFKLIIISGSMSFDPYARDATTGRRLPQTMWETHQSIARFDNAGLAIGGSLPLKKKNNTSLNDAQRQAIGNNYSAYADFNIPWTLNFNYNVNFRKNYLARSQKDTLLITQDLNFFGDVNLTPNWKIGIRSGYNFVEKNLTFTTFDIYRDLHCWEMRLNLIPFGIRRSYNFSLNVKASVLQDLKLLRRKDFRDFL